MTKPILAAAQKAAAEKAVGNVFKENADASFEAALRLALRVLAK